MASSRECEVGVDYGTLFGGTETLFRLCSPRSEIVSVGKFKEGGRLDRLDKFLSGPIFRMEVFICIKKLLMRFKALVLPASTFTRALPQETQTTNTDTRPQHRYPRRSKLQ